LKQYHSFGLANTDAITVSKQGWNNQVDEPLTRSDWLRPCCISIVSHHQND
jgi:hypothetical protein